MLSKRSLGLDLRDLPPKKKFRANLGDLVLSNTISAERASSLFSDAASSGARHGPDLLRGGWAHAQASQSSRVRCASWNTSLQSPTVCQDPTSAPTTRWSGQCGGRTRRMKQSWRKHLSIPWTSSTWRAWKAKWGCHSWIDVWFLGLWLDGVAARRDQTESIDTMVLSFPG